MDLAPLTEHRGDIEVYTPQEMALRLADMKQKLGLVQSFFGEIMIKNQDYGIIPGTAKPTLLKPGAEKLCELYGFAITVKKLDETIDRETGYYRAIVTVALVHRKSGLPVAEGVGEANTHEGRYRWRWVPEWKLPKGVDKDGLHVEERTDKNGKTYSLYRVQNEDPWALWNTVLKMAKKRALIDAVLSATRSSGLFTQDMEDLQEWAEAGAAVGTEGEGERPGQSGQQRRTEPAKGSGASATEKQQKAVYAAAKSAGVEDVKAWLKERYGVESTKDLTKAQASDALDALKGKEKKPQQPSGKTPEVAGNDAGEGNGRDWTRFWKLCAEVFGSIEAVNDVCQERFGKASPKDLSQQEFDALFAEASAKKAS